MDNLVYRVLNIGSNHLAADDIVSYLKESFQEQVENWFKYLSPSRQNALRMLDFDRTVITSMMFFSDLNSNLPYFYEDAMTTIVDYITATTTRQNLSSIPGEFRNIVKCYERLLKNRERIVWKNDNVLSLLSPSLRQKVITELLDKDVEFLWEAKELTTLLQDCRKGFLHYGINCLAKKEKKD